MARACVCMCVFPGRQHMCFFLLDRKGMIDWSEIICDVAAHSLHSTAMPVI